MFKKKIISYFILFSFLVFFFVIANSDAKAQSPYPEYSGCNGTNFHLVPCGRNTDDPCTPENETQMCTLCHLIYGIRRILHYGFIIIVFAALVLLVIAGIMYIVSAGTPGMMQTAKNLLFNVLIGFSLVLLAWLLINYLMFLIVVKNDLGIGKSWFSFECNTTSTTPMPR